MACGDLAETRNMPGKGALRAPSAQRLRIQVRGVVQGVGFRPFVYALATQFRLAGMVRNDASGVFAEGGGHPGAMGGSRAPPGGKAPPLAVIEEVITEWIAPTGDTTFTIAPSVVDGQRASAVTADSATCNDCLSEMRDPHNRRH